MWNREVGFFLSIFRGTSFLYQESIYFSSKSYFQQGLLYFLSFSYIMLYKGDFSSSFRNCNGARARPLPNSAMFLLYSTTYYIIAYYLVLFPTVGSPTTSALAARATYLFIPAIATSFPSPQLSIFVQQQSISFGSEAIIRARYRNQRDLFLFLYRTF